MRIAGATAAITGGGSGLGEATARRLCERGANVVLIDLNEAAGTALAKELGTQAAFVRADVASSESVQEAMDFAANRFGALHVLINCAGISPFARTLSRSGPHDIEIFRKTIAVNLVGTFDATRLAAQKMAANEPNENGERGVIVNTASIAAYEGQIGMTAYAASKGGVISLTIALARDLASFGIRVCSIAPGPFETPMMAVPDDVKASLGAATPFPPRLGKPEEYAMLVEHIIVNTMLNGETIRLDGALRLGPR